MAIDNCSHRFGNMDTYPRKCWGCGKDESEINTARMTKALCDIVPEKNETAKADGDITSPTQQLVGSSTEIATEIIENIWSRWYGKYHGDVDTDIMAGILADAKVSIIAAMNKSDQEMERVKACEHIAEGDMDGNDWRILRNICPSTMAVAALRDKYEALLKRELSGLSEEAAETIKYMVEFCVNQGYGMGMDEGRDEEGNYHHFVKEILAFAKGADIEGGN